MRLTAPGFCIQDRPSRILAGQGAPPPDPPAYGFSGKRPGLLRAFTCRRIAGVLGRFTWGRRLMLQFGYTARRFVTSPLRVTDLYWSPNSCPVRNLRLPTAVSSLLLAGVLGLAPASAPAQESIGDARDQRDAIRQEAAEVAATIDLLDAKDAEVAQALEDLAAFIAKAEADIDAAGQEIVRAEADAAAADAEVTRLDGEIGVARDVVRQFAISTYMTDNADRLDLLLSSDDPRTGELRRFFVEIAGGSSDAAIDELRRLIDDQAVARRAADDAQGRANDARIQLEVDKAALQEAVIAAEAVRIDIQGRIDEWQGEAGALQAADAELTEFIRAEQIRIEAARQEELRRQQETELERQRQEELDRQRQEEAERVRQEELESQLDDQPAEAEPTPEPDPATDNEGTADQGDAPEPEPTPDPGDSEPPADAALSFVWPINGSISSSFGYRIHPIFGTQRFHSGIDINGGTGLPIAASASGVVITSGWQDGYGNIVVIDHGGGFATVYAHQSQLGVVAGETVTQGQIIGYVGSTGWSTGPHLHFEIRIDGSPVDPMAYL